MLHRARWCPVVLLMACGSSETIEAWPLPEDVTGGSVLIVVEWPSRDVAYAYPTDDPWHVELSDRPRAIRLLHFNARLDELGLMPGPIALGSTAGTADCAITAPRDTFSWLSAEPGAWGQDGLGADAALLDRLARSDCRRCTELDVESVRLGTDATVHFAAWLASGAALLGLSDGTLQRADRRGSVELGGCELRPLWSVASVGDNRFWVGGSQGFIAQVSIDEAASTCTVTTSTRPPETPAVYWIAEGDDEVYTMGPGGTVALRDDSGFRKILEVAMSDATSKGLLQRLGPRHLLIGEESGQLIEWRDGDVVRTDVGAKIETMIPLEGGGFLLGSSTPSAILHDARGFSDWQRLALGSGANVGALVPFRDGFFVSARGGVFWQYTWEEGPCEPALEFMQGNGLSRTALAGPDLILVPDLVGSGPGEDTEVLWLIPR